MACIGVFVSKAQNPSGLSDYLRGTERATAWDLRLRGSLSSYKKVQLLIKLDFDSKNLVIVANYLCYH